jgi:Na+/melibiose symporter-like transporter
MSRQRTSLFAYGLLALPLAMVALPIYVQIPNYYATHVGLDIASIGLILFFVRLIDTGLDPFIGHYIARSGRGISSALLIGALVIAVSFYALWLPPLDIVDSSPEIRLAWLSFFLCLVYLAHSLMQISFMAWGAQLQDPRQSVLMRASAWREGFGLLGIMIASTLPSFILNGESAQIRSQLTWYIAAFILVLVLAYLLLNFLAMPYVRSGVAASAILSKDTSDSTSEARSNISKESIFKSIKLVFQQPHFKHLASIYFVNSLALGISSSLVLFFINDYLLATKLTPYYLGSYFLAASVGLPIWVKLAQRWGNVLTWKIAIMLNVLGFIGVLMLDADSQNYFFLICIGSGFALGADLALPPVMLNQLIPKHEGAARYFGVWNFIAKLAVSCAGLSLTLLAFLGYQANSTASHTDTVFSGQTSLLLVYALLPCCLKLMCLALLWNYPNEKITPTPDIRA